MSTRLNTLILAAFAVSTLGGCIVGSQTVRDEPQATLPAAPPPPSDEADALPPDPGAPEPGAEVDREVFVERLSPYGHWEFVPDYGQVWVPAVASGWRPYWDGHWVLTEWGWTFVSDDPWGWATYHYGRWGFTAGTGWFWVPGSVWAPAWVSWRYGAGYCAWAPLGPHGYVYGYSSPAWVAVRQEHFTQPIVRYAVVDVRRTTPIVQRAQPLAAPRVRPAPGAHFGPPVAQVAAATGHAVHPVRAAAVVPRPAPVAASGGRAGGARVAPSQAVPRVRAGPSSPGTPSGAPAGSSGGSRAAPSAAPHAAPHAAPAHGGSTYRIESPSAAPGTYGASHVGGAIATPSGGIRSGGTIAVPSGGMRSGGTVASPGGGRFGGGPAPRAVPGRGSAARPSAHRR
jgi:hypothetical protein